MGIVRFLIGVIINIFISGVLATYMCYFMAIIGKDYYGRIHDYWQLGIFVLFFPIMLHFVKNGGKNKSGDNGADAVTNETIMEPEKKEPDNKIENNVFPFNNDKNGSVNHSKSDSNEDSKSLFKHINDKDVNSSVVLLGNEPEDIQIILKPFLQELMGAFPDKVIVWNNWNHGRWDKAASYLCNSLGFQNGRSFLESYGFKIAVDSNVAQNCSLCGKKIPTGSKYCPHCGNKI